MLCPKRCSKKETEQDYIDSDGEFERARSVPEMFRILEG